MLASLDQWLGEIVIPEVLGMSADVRIEVYREDAH